MKRLLGYRKKIVSLMCAVMVISIGILSTSFNSFASAIGVTIQTTFCEPTVDDNSGYVALRQSAGDYVYYWTITPNITTNQNSKMQIILNANQMVFQAYGVGASQLSLWAIGLHNGRLYNVCTAAFQDSYQHIEAMGTPSAYTVKGNCSRITDNVYGQNHAGVAMVWNNNGSDFTKLVEIHNSINGVYSNTQGTNSRLDSMIGQLNNLTSEVDNVEETLNSMYTIMTNYYDLFDERLEEIYVRLGDMVEEQKKTNTWLGKIWDSIQEFINPKNEDSSKTDDFQNSSNAQKDEINELNEQNQVDKVDVDSASTQVDSSINYDNMAEYGGVLATVTNNNYVLQMLLIVVAIAVIAYVLFGKR